MLIEWLHVVTGHNRRVWEDYEDDRLYAVYVSNVIDEFHQN